MLSLTGVERSYASALHQTMQTLTVRAEVGAVMEGMLGDLEAWEWANQEEALKKELEFERAQVAALRASETALLEVRAQRSVLFLRSARVLVCVQRYVGR